MFYLNVQKISHSTVDKNPREEEPDVCRPQNEEVNWISRSMEHGEGTQLRYMQERGCVP